MSIADPRDIPGLVVWYSAQYESANYTDGQQVSGWTDLSVAGNNAVASGTTAPKWEAGTSPDGPSLRFDGGQYVTLPNVMSGATAGTIFFRVKSDGSGKSNNLLHQFSHDINTNYVGAAYPWTDSKIYDSWGSNRRNVFTPTLAVTQWRTFEARSDTALTHWLDGVQQAVSTTTLTVPEFNVTAPLVGARLSPDYPGYFWGNVSAVIVYDRALTDTERGEVESWLAANPWGGSIPAQIRPTNGTLSLAASAPLVTHTSKIKPTDAVLSLLASSPAVTHLSTIRPLSGSLGLTATAPKVMAAGLPAPRYYSTPVARQSLWKQGILSHYGTYAGITLFRNPDGTWVEHPFPTLSETLARTEGVDMLYGGRVYELSDTIYDEITASGYGEGGYGAGGYGS